MFTVGEELPSSPVSPAFLVLSGWDDYKFKTEFTLHLAIDGAYQRIGRVKIFARAMSETDDGWTREYLNDVFVRLDPTCFCSIGQEASYYSRLGSFPNGEEVLTGLADLSFHRESWVLDDGVVESSLLRKRSARLLIPAARDHFAGRRPDNGQRNQLAYRNRYDVGGPKHFQVDFDATLDVPGRCHVVVGKNGVGKTSLVLGLAHWLGSSGGKQAEGDHPNFSKVVVVSFNAFDGLFRELGRVSDVVLVGQRLTQEQRANLMKASKKLEQSLERYEFSKAEGEALMALINYESAPVDYRSFYQLSNDSEWLAFIEHAFESPKLSTQITSSPEDALSQMSAGQRVLVALYAALFFHLDHAALVIIDEPEAHLHPSLIARFMRCLNELLSKKRSFAVITTHSPIIVQETPSKFVSILSRHGDVTTSGRPLFQTFGEGIDEITADLFETDFRSSHWKRLLRGFVKMGLSNEDIADKFDGQLSLSARAFIANVRHLGA